MSTPETEVEKLLRVWVPTSPFKNKSYIVGGYVRDQLLGFEGKDLDLVVEEKGGAEAFCKWLHNQSPESISQAHPLGAGYPIWQIVFKENIASNEKIFYTKGCQVEVADTQAESFPDPKSRQRISVFGSIEEDCKRRDFTSNMLYRDLSTGALVDPSGCGESDIRSGILRGHPEVKLAKIFSDDPLRMIRLFRFHCRFGWSIPQEVLDTVVQCHERIQILSPERIRDEVWKMAETGKLYLALELMQKTKTLDQIFPELVPMIGCTQDKFFHSEGDVWQHTLLVLQNTPADSILQLAALFHDSGKPATRSVHGERIKFLGHEVISEKIAEAVLKRLHFDSQTITKVKNLVRHHMRGGDVEQWTSLKPARKLLRDVGDDLDDLIRLIEADSKSSFDPHGNVRTAHIELLKKTILKSQEIPIRKKSILSGDEIMNILQIPSGKKVAEVKEFLENLEDEFADKGEVLDKEAATLALQKKFLV